MPPNIVGRVIAGQFRVDAFIAAGGMGSIYRVWDLKRNAPLAMKILHNNLSEDPTFFKFFKREARALKKLYHPNIVPFYGYYETPELVFLLQHFIDGPTLKEVLAEHSVSLLPDRDVLCILNCLCSALGYAHNNNVIHCDIKPANVMIDSGGHVYLADFSIARHSGSDLTFMPGAGTPAYMAPEQIQEADENKGTTVSPATDIYALGILLFELLTGRCPFNGNEIGIDKSKKFITERIRYAQVNLPAPDPRLINPRISPQLSAIILRALAKEPEARFSSCKEFIVAVCGAYGTTPDLIPDRLTGINPATTPPPPPPPPPSKKGALVYVGAAAIVLVLSIFFLAGRFERKPEQTLVPSYFASISTADAPPNPTPQTDEDPTKTQNPVIAQAPLPTSTHSAAPLPTNTVKPTTPPRTETSFTKYRPFTNCPESQLHVGNSAYVSYNSKKISLRSEPVGRIGDTLIRKLDEGEVVHIIDGPVCDLNLVLWKVRTVQNEFGWLPEGDASEFWIIPITTKKVCSDAKPSRLWIGATAFVEPVPKDRNIMFSEPAMDLSKELYRMKPGSYMQVLKGPSCGTRREGVWWYVRSADSGIEGWTRESDYSRSYYFIAPVIPRP